MSHQENSFVANEIANILTNGSKSAKLTYRKRQTFVQSSTQNSIIESDSVEPSANLPLGGGK
jgi:flagellar basal body rod protein FlgC